MKPPCREPVFMLSSGVDRGPVSYTELYWMLGWYIVRRYDAKGKFLDDRQYGGHEEAIRMFRLEVK